MYGGFCILRVYWHASPSARAPPGRLSALSVEPSGFAAPAGIGDAGQPQADVEMLRAAYPMQLLVRLDTGPRKAIVYDAFEYVPTTRATFSKLQQAGEELVTPRELKAVERIAGPVGTAPPR